MKAEILETIFKASPTQKKKIDRFFASCPQAEKDLDVFLAMYGPFMAKSGISPVRLATSYQDMVDDMMHSRLSFLREGVYPAKSQKTAIEEVYANPAAMTPYVLGIALSQFLWKHHYDMYVMYREEVRAVKPGGRCLEVGCGHGLFLLEMFRNLPADSVVDVVDISETSIALASGVLKSVDASFHSRANFFHKDLADFEGGPVYDFITMGEVLEHVEDPARMLRKLATLLKPGGRLFVTTCANCPAIDHVYHFRNMPEIRDMITAAGFKIEREAVIPSEDKSPAELEKHQIDISYAAIVTKGA